MAILGYCMDDHYKKCDTNYDDCECFACLEVKKETVEFGRKAMANARATFGETKYGRPSKRIIKPIITEVPPPKITKETWFFMTGTLFKNTHLHNDRCGAKCVDCKCGDGGNEKC